jgi:hypothetical protein
MASGQPERARNDFPPTEASNSIVTESGKLHKPPGVAEQRFDGRLRSRHRCTSDLVLLIGLLKGLKAFDSLYAGPPPS